MRRRLATILTTAMLGSMLLLPAVAAPALAAETAVVLAAEGGEVLSPPGRTADDEENEFAPEKYEGNWTWRAGKVLLVVFLIAGLYLGLMYYLRVSRPARSNRS